MRKQRKSGLFALGFCAMFALVGALSFAAAVRMWWRTLTFHSGAQTATATVTGKKIVSSYKRSQDQNVLYYEFRTADGFLIQGHDSVEYWPWHDTKVGARIPAYYLQSDPKRNALARSWWNSNALVFGIVGCVFGFVGSVGISVVGKDVFSASR